MLTTRRILMSCANKRGLTEFWKDLTNNNMHYIKGIASDGTYEHLQKSSSEFHQYTNIDLVETITEYPSLLNGKVKTLHPKIFTGILADPDNSENCQELDRYNINPIDIVCINLYNVEEQLQQYYDAPETVRMSHWSHNVDEHPILSHTDIGGSAMLRAACKNYANVLPIVDPNDYDYVLETLYSSTRDNIFISLNKRREFAAKAFDHVTCHDMMISQYLNYGNITYRKYTQITPLKYGCNPPQKAALLQVSKDGCHSINQPMPFEVLNGDISYINILDAVLSWNCVDTLSTLLDTIYVGVGESIVATSFKHNSPAGVFKTLKSNSLYMCPIHKARNCDPLSSFGDFIGYSGTVTVDMATYLKTQVSDGIIAADFTDEALEILRKKKNGNYTILKADTHVFNEYNYATNTGEYRELYGIGLYQEQRTLEDLGNIMDTIKAFHVENEVNCSMIHDAYIGTIMLNFVPSNSVSFTYDGQVVGIGCGQQNRVDCVRIAGNKARKWANENGIDLSDEANKKMFVMSSDGFLPFKDNVEVAKEYNVGLIVQPGGSIRDDEIQDVCDEAGIQMIKTGQRLFTH